MNMIPSVMANEPGRAQNVNLDIVPNCSLLKHCQREPGRKSFWKKASERVRIPYGVLVLSRTACSRRVAYFGSGALNGR